MINVFKKRTSLYALTTSAFFFLQGVDISVASNPAPAAAKKGDAAAVQVYTCNAKSYNLENSPILCADGKKHDIKYSAIQVTKVNDNAVEVLPKVTVFDKNSRMMFPVEMEVAGTVVNLKQVGIRNDAPFDSIMNYVMAQDTDLSNNSGINSELDGGSAVVVGMLSKANLTNSGIRNFVVGLESKNGGKISMEDGSVTRVRHGVMSFSQSFVTLKDTLFDVTESVVRSVDSGVSISKGQMSLKEGGIGFMAENKGAIVVTDSQVQVFSDSDSSKVKENIDEYEGPDSVGFLLQDGFMAFNKSKFSGNNTAFMWIRDQSFSDNPRSNFSAAPDDLSKLQHVFPPADNQFFGNVNATLTSILGDQKAKMGAWRLDAYMSEATVELREWESYGIYFDRGKESEEEIEKQEERNNEIVEVLPEARSVRHLVYLNQSSITTSSGLGIYGEESEGIVVLDNNSKISGRALLKASFGSTLSVFAHNSKIFGSADIDESSKANFYLSGGAGWYLDRNTYSGWKSPEANANCVDSCISSITLTNSSIGFVPLNKDYGVNASYKTLRIGNGNGTVYKASGDSKLYLNVSASPLNVQTSDRLLIHGNVDGKTKVYVNDKHIYDVSGEQEPQKKVPDPNGVQRSIKSSISIIQVYGNANTDSFTLADGYVTIDGSPYQYVLRAYGPVIAPGMEYFDARLAKNEQIWDFRLEGKIQNNGKQGGEDDNVYPSAFDRALAKYMSYDINYPIPGDPEFVDKLLKASGRDVFSIPATVILNENGEMVGYDYSYLDGIEDYEGFEFEDKDYELQTTDREGGDLSIVLLQASNENAEYGIVEEDELTQAVTPSNPASVVSPTSENSTLARSDTGSSDLDSLFTMERTSSSTLDVPTEKPVSSNGEEQSVESSASATGITVDTASKRVEVSKASSTSSKQKEPSPKQGGAKTLGRGRILTISEKSPSTESVNTPSSSTKSPEAVSSIQSIDSLGRSLKAPSTLVYSVVQEGVSFQCGDTTQNGGGEKSQVAYSCSDGKLYTMKDLTLKASGKTQHSMHAKNENTIIKLEAVTISGPDFSNLNNGIDLAQSELVSAVLAEEKAEVVLDKNSTIQSSVIGLEAKSGGKVKMNDGTVNARYVGALAGSGSSVNLKGTKINVMGDFAAAGLASKAGEITMDSGSIAIERGVAVRSESKGSIKLDKVSITAKKAQDKSDSSGNLERAAFLLADNGSVDFKNGSVVTDAHALWVVNGSGNEADSTRKKRASDVRSAMNHANIESSTVKVEGDGTYGIYFDGVTQKEGSKQTRGKDLATEKAIVKRSAVSTQEKTPIGVTGAISLKKTKFEVANGIAIYGNHSGGRVSLENKTTLAGDFLLKAENDSNILVSVNNSIVTGDVRVDKSSYAKLDLVNSSEWILKRSSQRNLGVLDSGCVDSCVSAVSLVNSVIDFRASKTQGQYQTLHIGNGTGRVYEAQGDALIHLNARLNPHDPSDQQVTDRIVIHGDVSGKTKIHVRGDAGNVGNGQENAKIAHSVSIIQVYGQAKKDSFQLDGDYVALINSPYKYTLRAYAPEATSKQEHVQQKFVKDGGKFWNFRLENQYVKSVGSAGLPEQFVRSVVPQVPTYLVLPNSVFHAGLMDISNQNKQLETLRTTSNGMVDVRENPALYLRGYGGSYRYTSDLSALEYGYAGDLSYNGVEAGVLLQTIENADTAMSFGVMGIYGKLSLQPLDVDQSQKSAFDKWTATVYGSMQHDAGFYVDGLLSYGLFKGDVLTLARGKTATLKGNPLSVSLSGGQTIATGYKDFVFDPQVQVVYQHLQFNKVRDIDNFDIEMGKLDQWVARVGGRLTKVATGSEGVDAVAFYGKLYLAHGFGEKQSVHFNDAFKLGAFGSSLEAGLGFNAKLLPQFSLHADILYQHKLNKAGFSGASFSGGVRYQF
ncbi:MULTISPECIES: autotransporter outer membrane beta-barrel domain-containing protein [unclassified Bartonella]|uniref:autotransporter outer membrane beta-barrel domain-containing protein n=1 Tax=unclassified Bartonella TaxID=2645622 RepID=UPI0035D05324